MTEEQHVIQRFDKITRTLKSEGFVDLASYLEREYPAVERLAYMEQLHVSSWRCYEESRALLRTLSFLRFQSTRLDNSHALKAELRNTHDSVVNAWSGKYNRDREQVRIDLRECANGLETKRKEQAQKDIQRRREADAERERLARQKAQQRWSKAIGHAKTEAHKEIERKREFDKVERYWFYPYGIFPETPFRSEDVTSLVTFLNTQYSGLAERIVSQELKKLETRFGWGIEALDIAERFQQEIFAEIEGEQRQRREFIAKLIGGLIGAGLTVVLGPIGPAIGTGIASVLGSTLTHVTTKVVEKAPSVIAEKLGEAAQKRIEDAIKTAKEKAEAACESLIQEGQTRAADAIAERIVPHTASAPESIAQSVRRDFDRRYRGIHDGIINGIQEICGAGAFVEGLRQPQPDSTQAELAQRYKAIDYLWEVHAMTREQIGKMSRKTRNMLSDARFARCDLKVSHCSDGLLYTATSLYIENLVAELARRLREEFSLGELPDAPAADKQKNVEWLTSLWKVCLLSDYVHTKNTLDGDEAFGLPGPMYTKYTEEWFSSSVKDASGNASEKLKFENRTSGTMRLTKVNDPVRIRAWLYYIQKNVNPCEALFRENVEEVLQRVKRAAQEINQFMEDKKSGKRTPKESHPNIATLIAYVDSSDFKSKISV